MAYFVGLDLGQSADYTALAVVQSTWGEGGDGKPKSNCTFATWSATP
jgi:hypothetical protein